MSNLPLVSAFAKKHKRKWNHLDESVKLTNRHINKIVKEFSLKEIPMPSDADLVVFGSIARKECTKGSDVDWTLLVDGQVRNEFEYSKIIKKALVDLKMQKPGISGMFGQITFSHNLVHFIGGEEDTNHNTSRRILLLLESDKLLVSNENDSSGTAYERVVRAIIKQYVDHDSGLSSINKDNARVPRFLLNDIIRFWRTMCVDFAYKQKEQDGFKWGLRNIKLRLSRKLLYVKGILMCFSCQIEANQEISKHLSSLAKEKPLDIILKVLENRVDSGLLLDLFDTYNNFIGLLGDKKVREKLEKV